MSKENQSVDQSANCRLRVPEIFCKEQDDAAFVKGTRIYPPLALTTEHIYHQSSHLKFISKENNKTTRMPAIRRAFTRTFQPVYSPYGPLNTDIYDLQASILDNIQEISAFTMSNLGIQMDASNLVIQRCIIV
jgi:hypothetical protein